ncbi:MAG: iron complex transport system substrate-binding protein [Mycobacterium sp.]|nr:iron complex transport system substrate-binding protein [Mycobacterium sp.]
MRRLSRRDLLGVAGAAGLSAVAACSTTKPSDKSPSEVTVEHRFGETKIAAPPKRVVSAGFTEQDDLLALGVTPIAVTQWWGDQPFATWPWALPRLGPAQPAVLSLDNGLDFDKIAALKPDLIVAVNAGVDQDSYNRLAAIAPTIPQSGDQAFFEPWKEQASAIGQAVFQGDQMALLVKDLDTKFTEIATSRPQFKDKRVLLMQGSFYLDNLVATLPGWRTEFLTQMGLAIPEEIREFGVDVNRALIPRDRAVAALGVADALIWTTESDDEQARLIADPTFAQLKSTLAQRNVFTGKDLAGAIAFSSPLSLPVVADQLPPMLAKAIG